MPKTSNVQKPQNRTHPIKVSPWFHTLVKQIANVTHEEIGAVLERVAGDALVAEHDKAQAKLKAIVSSRKG